MQVDLSADWRRGILRFDRALAPPGLAEAPLASPFGELALLCLLNHDRGLYVHASAALWPDGVDVFLGRSGAGKSTLSGLCKTRGADILSDDRTVLFLRDGRLWAAGTPFHGTGLHWSARMATVRGLFFLEHAQETSVMRMPVGDAAARLASTTFTEFWSAGAIARSLRMGEAACRAAHTYVFRFRPELQAVETLAEVALAA
jgi:hypothetical protein